MKVDLSQRTYSKSVLILSKLPKTLLHQLFFLSQLAHLLIKFANHLVCISQPFTFQVQRFDILEVEKFLVGTVRIKAVVFFSRHPIL